MIEDVRCYRCGCVLAAQEIENNVEGLCGTCLDEKNAWIGLPDSFEMEDPHPTVLKVAKEIKKKITKIPRDRALGAKRENKNTIKYGVKPVCVCKHGKSQHSYSQHSTHCLGECECYEYRASK